VPTYYVSLIGGLEQIAAGEIAERLPGAQLLKSEFGRLRFTRLSGLPPPWP
jgi:hypothetical protein